MHDGPLCTDCRPIRDHDATLTKRANFRHAKNPGPDAMAGTDESFMYEGPLPDRAPESPPCRGGASLDIIHRQAALA
jgi:hypothetical protein